MSDRARNRPDSKTATDEWLTPPELINALGPFDLDPACAPRMPWTTAKRMVSNQKPGRGPSGPAKVDVADGLAIDWHGRVFLNPPYSDILPWAQKLAHHGNGMFLVPAKSLDTAWGQYTITHADAILFFKGRLAFCYPNGKSSGKGWGPSMLCAFDSPIGEPRILPPDVGANVDALFRILDQFPGVVLSRHSFI